MMISFRKTHAVWTFFLAMLACSISSFAQNSPVKVEKIWDKAPHNAFTDLIRYNNKFYCIFREAINHVDGSGKGDGKLRVLVSADGKKWNDFALLEREGLDLRDASLSETPDGRLMVVFGVSKYGGGKLHSRHTHVTFLNKSTGKFGALTPVKYSQAVLDKSDNPDMNWLWRVIWHKGTAYGVIYEEHDRDGKRLAQNSLTLVSSKDGVNYELVKSFDIPEKPDETSLRFSKNDDLYILVRMENKVARGILGKSKAPYTEWEMMDTGVKLGGPILFFTAKEEMLIGTRTYFNKEMQTALYGVDKMGGLQQLIQFPSAGDTSYPGIVEHNGTLYFSYYSSHEGKSNIYMATIPLSYIRGLNANLGTPFK